MALQKISKHVVQDNTLTGDQIGTIGEFTSTGIDDNATSTALTINSSNNATFSGLVTADEFNLDSGGTLHSTIDTSSVAIAGGTNSNVGANVSFYGSTHASLANIVRFRVNSTETMRIDSSGNVGIGNTPDGSAGTYGVQLSGDGYGIFARDGGVPAFFNRGTSDGDIIRLYQAATLEGTISVSGTTVSYNGFTGTHWSRFTDNSTPTILKGTVLESLDEMCDWYNLHFEITDEEGNTSTQKIPYVLQDGQSDGDVITYNHEGTDVQATIVKEADIKHVKSKVSDTVDTKNVYGVFVAYDEDDEGYNDFYVASVGSFVVRIKQGETIAKGDLLQSNGDGTAKVQTDDAIRASTFAKVLSTTVIETYDDGSFLVPCSLMC